MKAAHVFHKDHSCPHLPRPLMGSSSDLQEENPVGIMEVKPTEAEEIP